MDEKRFGRLDFCCLRCLANKNDNRKNFHIVRGEITNLLKSPSSPLLANPAKNAVPSAPKKTACKPSCPVAQRTIDGLFGRGSSYQRFDVCSWLWTNSPTVFNPREEAFPW
jgi:hypothetical protein